MAIFISKKAIEKIGIGFESISPGDVKNPPLKSTILKEDVFLQRLNGEELTVALEDILKPSSDQNEAYKKIKLGLNVLLHNDILDQNAFGFLNSGSGVWGDQETTLLNAFQTLANLSQTNFINPASIFELDRLLNSIQDRTQYDTLQSGEIIYVGYLLQSELNFRVSSNSTTVHFVDSQGSIPSLELSANQDLTLRAIIKYNENLDDNGLIPFQIPKKYLDESLFSDEEDKARSKNVIYIPSSGLTLPSFNGEVIQQITTDDLLNELERVPPNPLGEMAKLHLVGPGESFVDLAISNYFFDPSIPGSAPPDVTINNPNNTAQPSYTFPIPSKSPEDERSSDYRLKFYLNYLYYYNSVEDDNVPGGIREYGMKASSGYTRHNVANLENTYIFDNEFDPAVPDTGLSNFFRFMRAQETATVNSSEILFNSSGEATSFEPEPNYYIWIPERQFIDSFYYHLNFRPAEMLDDAGNGILEFKDDISGFLSDLGTALDNTTEALSVWAKNEIEEATEAAFELLKYGYGYVIDVIAENIDRGEGGYVDGSLGVTWGAPIATDLSFQTQIWRKFTPWEELTIGLRQECEFKIGPDVFLGGNLGGRAGKSSGGGSNKKRSHFRAGGGFQIDAKIGMIIEYEFPIKPTNTALISAFIAVAGGAVAIGGTELLRAFTGINLSPLNYIKKISQLTGLSGEGFLGVQNQKPSFDENNVNQQNNWELKKESNLPAVQEKNRSQTSPTNINNYTPDLGISLTGYVNLGRSMTIEYFYDDDSDFPKFSTRVPKKTRFEREYFIEGGLGTGTLGNSFFKNIFLNLGVDFLFSALNLSGGFAVALVYEHERTSSPENLTNSDVDGLIGLEAPDANVQDDNGRMDIAGTGWKIELQIGSPSGATDILCTTGSECKIVLNAYEIFTFLNNYNSSTFNFSLDDALKMLQGIKFGFKLGLSFDTNGADNLNGNIMNSVAAGDKKSGNRSDFVGKKDKFGLTIGAGILVEFEFNFADIKEVLQYYFAILYLRFGEDPPLMADEKYDSYKEKLKKLKESLDQPGQSYAALYNALYEDLRNENGGAFGTSIDSNGFEAELSKILFLYNPVSQYLLGEDISDDSDRLAVTEILTVLTKEAIIETGRMNFSIEAKRGFSGAFTGKLGIAGVSLRLHGDLELAYMVKMQIYEKGNRSITDTTNDPDKENIENLYASIKTALNSPASSIRDTIISIRNILQ